MLSELEVREVRRIAGKIDYLRTAESSFASFASSYLQQCLPTMTISDIKFRNGTIWEVIRREATITCLKPNLEELEKARIVVFSDAGFSHSGERRRVAQEGCVCGISFGTSTGSIFHTIMFVSRKQRRVSQSPGAAETTAAISGYDYARQTWDDYQLANRNTPTTLVVDSKGLQESSAKKRSVRHPSMAVDVHMLRGFYAGGEINSIICFAGNENPAYPLTKPHAWQTSDLLHKMLVTGRLPVSISNIRLYKLALHEKL